MPTRYEDFAVKNIVICWQAGSVNVIKLSGITLCERKLNSS